MRSTHRFLVLLGVVLALAGPVACAGGMVNATFAGGGSSGPGAWSKDPEVLRRLMSTRLEDGVVPELTVDLDLHRRVLAGGGIGVPALNPDRPACPRSGSCGGRGRPYTNRGCQKIYRCPG